MNTENTDDYDVDPVCQMKVSKESKMPPFMFHSRAYHFCADACRKAFMADPEKYLKFKPIKPKGWWGDIWIGLKKQRVAAPPRVIIE